MLVNIINYLLASIVMIFVTNSYIETNIVAINICSNVVIDEPDDMTTSQICMIVIMIILLLEMIVVFICQDSEVKYRLIILIILIVTLFVSIGLDLYYLFITNKYIKILPNNQVLMLDSIQNARIILWISLLVTFFISIYSSIRECIETFYTPNNMTIIN